MTNGIKTDVTMLIGLKGYVDMVFKRKLFNYSSSIISRKRIKVFNLPMPYPILTQDYKISLLRFVLKTINIWGLQNFVRHWEGLMFLCLQLPTLFKENKIILHKIWVRLKSPERKSCLLLAVFIQAKHILLSLFKASSSIYSPSNLQPTCLELPLYSI
jgi:hypothetical protein